MKLWWIVLAGALAGVVLGWGAHAFVDRPSATTTGTVTWRAVKGGAACLKPAHEHRVCGIYVKGTGGPQPGDLKVGDRVQFRVTERSVSGAQLKFLVGVA